MYFSCSQNLIKPNNQLIYICPILSKASFKSSFKLRDWEGKERRGMEGFVFVVWIDF